jgi:GDP-L-fucose synthase
MRRFHEAKVNDEESVVVWGSGNAMREFLYVDDMAEASLFILEMNQKTYHSNTRPMLSHINIGTGKDITIKELAKTMKEVVGFQGKLVFDESKPDGTARKLIDVTRLSNSGWNYKVDLKKGLEMTYSWFADQDRK